MSVGTWILSVFGPAAGIAAVAEAAPLLPERGVLGLGPAGCCPRRARRRPWVAAVTAPALATYTGVLLADTAVPSWHEAYPELPAIFAQRAGQRRRVGLVGPRPARRPLRRGASRSRARRWSCGVRTGWRTGSACSASPTRRAPRQAAARRPGADRRRCGRRAGRRASRVLSALSGGALIAASVCTRFGIFHGGVALGARSAVHGGAAA
ncbi:hypothetical protein [Micromonospora sp. b486]|uniref:hypothetical protein n=1 Tax=Micromonospora sp. b486 TaxID=3053986 RepID=UPI00338FB4C3